MERFGKIISILVMSFALIAGCDGKNDDQGQGETLFAVSVNGVSMVSSSSARVGGVFVNFGTDSPDEIGAAYRKEGQNQYIHVAAQQIANTFTVDISDLEAGTHYFVKTYVRSANNTVYSEREADFTTLGSGENPVTADVETGDAVELTAVGATLKGSYSLTGDGEIDEAGFAYRRFDSSSYAHVSASVTGGDFALTLGSCQSSTTYYYKAYVVIAGVRYYGLESSFTTLESSSGQLSTQKYFELPLLSALPDCQYVTHFIPGTQTRNFSLCYNSKERIPMWVAYPMHRCYDGSAGRNDSWTYDPQIPSGLQPNLSSSYSGNYSRGHMCASSDRQVSVAANKQTFYYTNMCPQIQNEFNGGIWSSLETKVQSYDWICDDTLYVVTGAAMIGDYSHTTTKTGQSVAVPTNFYKVLVRSRSGVTGKPLSQLDDSQIQCVGFWLNHFGYGTKDKISRNEMKSVSEIEQLSGFTFFPELSEQVKQSYDPEDWGM